MQLAFSQGVSWLACQLYYILYYTCATQYVDIFDLTSVLVYLHILSFKTWHWLSIYTWSVHCNWLLTCRLKSCSISKVIPRFFLCVWKVCHWVSADLSAGQWSNNVFVVFSSTIEKSQIASSWMGRTLSLYWMSRGPHCSLPYRCSTNTAHWS